MNWMRLFGFPIDPSLDNMLTSEWLRMKQYIGQQALCDYAHAATEFMRLELNRQVNDPVSLVDLHVRKKCLAIALASALLAFATLPLLLIWQAAGALPLAFVMANATWRILRWRNRAWLFRQMIGIVDLMASMRDCEHLAEGRPLQLRRFMLAEKRTRGSSGSMHLRVVYGGMVDGRPGLIECRVDGATLDQLRVEGLQFSELLDCLDDRGSAVLGFAARRELFQAMPDAMFAELDVDCYRHGDLLEFATIRDPHLLERLPESLHSSGIYEVWIRNHLDCLHDRDELLEVFAAHPGDVLDRLLGAAAEFNLDCELPSTLALRLLGRAKAWQTEGRMDGYCTLLRWIFWITVGIRYKSPEVAEFGRLLGALSRQDSIVNTSGAQIASRECYEQIIGTFARDLGSEMVAAGCHDREARIGFMMVFGRDEAMRHFHAYRREFIAHDIDL